MTDSQTPSRPQPEGAPPADPGLLYPSQVHGSAGSLLRTARQKTGLTLEELAMQTKMPVAVLDAMERDDYVRLGQPVYLRGYLRKYAKALGLSDAEVVAAYDSRETPQQPDPQQMRLAREAVEVKAESKAGMWWLMLILAVIAGGLAFWVFSTPVKRTAPAPVPAPSASSPPPVAPASTPELTAPVPTPEESTRESNPESTSPADSPAAPTTPRATDGSAAPAASPPVVDELKPAPGSQQPAPAPGSVEPAPKPPVPPPNSGAATPGHAQAIPVSSNPPQPLSSAATVPRSGLTAGAAFPETATETSQLTLAFRDKSWVLIKDGRNKVLLNGLVEAGRTESMTGVPPYTVTLARAAAVEVQYQGQAVDLAPYTANNGTAHFNLPAVQEMR
jgi:cytoskeleton protein RodZ